jgi:hypothetical protein
MTLTTPPMTLTNNSFLSLIKSRVLLRSHLNASLQAKYAVSFDEAERIAAEEEAAEEEAAEQVPVAPKKWWDFSDAEEKP